MVKTVWYITKYFSPKMPGSAGGRSWFLMKELASSGYRPVVITSDSNNLVDLPDLTKSVTVEDVDGVTLVWLKTLKYKLAKSPRRILSWLDFELKLFILNKGKLPNPDVIVVSSLSILTIINGIWLKKKYGCRLVFEIRDIWPLTIIEEGGYSHSNPLIKLLSFVERLGYKKSDLIIGTMPNLKPHIKEVSGLDKAVTCIPMGVEIGREDDVQELELEGRYISRYLSSEKFKIVHAGTIGITNALDVFFETAKAFVDNESIEFIVVGDGALKDHYVNEYGHLGNLIFAPKVPRKSVQEVLGYCDLVFFSMYASKVWDSGQSLNKVVDYMLSGKPVLAAYSGYQSMINEADCGSFVPAEDRDALIHEIERYAKMAPEELDKIGRRGKDWILENRNYKKLANEFAQVIFDGI
jgi:glycosyltransferase involved in cell wall biosynthesis